MAVSVFCLAASADVTTLTWEQTLAYYGTQIGGTIKPAINADAVGVQFDYIGHIHSSSWGFDYGYGIGKLLPAWMDGQAAYTNGTLIDAGGQTFPNFVAQHDALIYRASASQWGGSQITTFGALFEPLPQVQLHVASTVQIQGLSLFRQYIGYSASQNANPAINRTNASYNSGQYVNAFALSPVIGGQYQSIGYPFRAALPNYLVPTNETPQWNDTSRIAMFYAYNEGENFSLGTGLQINAYWVGSATPSNPDVYLVIGCPDLEFAPVETTTATTVATTRKPAGTGATGLTGIGTTQTGTDLNMISADLREIINNQRWQIRQGEVISENSRIIANNTNEILNTLNLIYAAMLQGGEVPVEPDPDGFDMGAINSAVQGYTTARIPEQAENGLRFWAALIKYINDELTWAAALGALGLALSVTGWILFRGRNA